MRLSGKMKINLDMLGASMKHQVGRQICSTKVVAPEDRWTGLMDTKILNR
jgi:hypothetical protein